MQYMSRRNIKQLHTGFTLVEMLVVAPIVILIIAGFIAVMINMTGDILASREKSSMTFATQDALDRLEQDIKLSAQFLSTTGTLSSPQGSNNLTAAFTATPSGSQTSNLLLSAFATTGSPVNTEGRSLVYLSNSPNACASVGKTYNQPLSIMVVYFLNGSTLWRRTIVPTGGSFCDPPWQRNSCADGQTAALCRAKDEKILENVTAFKVDYCSRSGACAGVTPQMADGIQASITTTQSVAGMTNTITLSLNATHLNTTKV